jgi:SAM-dependent methyltransferase
MMILYLGRIACKVAPRVGELTCFDISDEMLKKARKSLAARGLDAKSKFALLPDSRLPERYSSYFDFIYVFDCFPHVDLRILRMVLRFFFPLHSSNRGLNRKSLTSVANRYSMEVLQGHQARAETRRKGADPYRFT